MSGKLGKHNTTRDKGVAPDFSKALPKEMLTDAEPAKVLTLEEHIALIKKNNVSPPKACLLIVAPILEKRLKSGIYIPEVAMNDETKAASFFKWHHVVAVGGSIDDVKVGDEIWVNRNRFADGNISVGVPRVEIEGVLYMKVDYYMIDGIKHNENN